MSFINENNLKEMIEYFNEIVKEYYEIPDLLYHYTNISGLKGIITSNKIWATDYRFLNDKSEIEYGLDLLEEVLVDRIEYEKSEVSLYFLNKFLNMQRVLIDFYNVHIVCFSDNENLLNQWRYYGDKGNGYSIEIKTDKLKNKNYKIAKVIYSRTKQRLIINKIIDYYCEYCEKLFGVKPEENKEYRSSMVSIIILCTTLMASIICLFKDKAFEDERELRLVYFIPLYSKLDNEMYNVKLHDKYLDEIKIRHNDEIFIPYVEIDLINNNESAIKSIMCGPSNEMKIKTIGLETFMVINNYKDIEIKESQIPLRK